MNEQPNPPWGPMCVCGDLKIVHRGEKHDGSCSSLQCALNVVNGWAYDSRCKTFREKMAPQPDPLDSDTPHSRARGEA